MSFWKKYGWKIALSLVVIIVLIYVSFVSEFGVLATGNDLEKKDWLSFWAGYLSFAGALFLGAVALWQNEKANEMNKAINELNKRSVLIDEEKSYPYLLANSNRDQMSKRQIARSDGNGTEIVFSKHMERGSITLDFEKVFLDEDSDCDTYKIVIPIKIKNNSNTYITYSKMNSISAAFLPVETQKIKKFDELIKYSGGEKDFLFQSLQPNQEMVFSFSLITNYSDIVKYIDTCLEYITFEFEVHTLNHVCKQEISMNFGDNYTYKYHKLRENDDGE